MSTWRFARSVPEDFEPRPKRSTLHLLGWLLTLLVLRDQLQWGRHPNPDTTGFLIFTAYPSERGILNQLLDNYPPGTLLLQYPLARLVESYPFVALNTVHLAMILAMAWGMRSILGRYAGERAGNFAAWFLVLGFCAPRVMATPLPDIPMAFFQFWSLAAYLRGVEPQRRAGMLVTTGFLAGAASFFKFHGILILPAELLALLPWGRNAFRGAPWRTTLAQAVPLMLGALFFWGLAATVIYMGGGLQTLWEYGILHGLTYAQHQHGQVLQAALHALFVMGFCWLALWIGLLGTLGRAFTRRDLSRPEAALMIWVVIICAVAAKSPNAFTVKYFLAAIIPLAMLGGIFFSRATVSPWLGRGALAAAAIAPVAYYVAYRYANPIAQEANRSIQSSAAFIRERYSPKDTMLVLEPVLRHYYTFAECRPWPVIPDWLVVQHHMPEHPGHWTSYRPIPAAQIEKLLLRAPPRCLVDHTCVEEFKWLEHHMPHFARLYSLIHESGPIRIYELTP